MANKFPQGIEIFRAGRHVDSAGVARAFSDADIRAIAAGYASAKHEAPIVVGHPAMDAPAYGWVEKVHAVPGDGGARLVIDARDVEPQFAEMVKSRRFPNRSAAFYAPDNPSNPTPGQWYLRHVGFLGAAAPAVRGLQAIQFSDTGESVVFSQENQEDPAMPKEEQEEIERLRGQNAQLAADLEAANTAAAAAQKQAAAFAEARRHERHAAHAAFAEAELKAGRLLPKDKAAAVAVLDALAEAAKVEFADGDAQKSVSPVEFVKSLISSSAPAVNFGEYAPGGAPAVRPKTEEELDAAAKRYAAQHNVAYAEAAHKVIDLGA